MKIEGKEEERVVVENGEYSWGYLSLFLHCLINFIFDKIVWKFSEPSLGYESDTHA